MKKINFTSEILFPMFFHLIAAAAVLMGIFLVQNLTASIILILGAILVFTGRSGIEIDPAKKRYRPYYSFFFIKFGKSYQYNSVEKIYVNANRVAQKFYTAHTNDSTTFRNVEYDGYIKFDDGTKEFLLSKRSKEPVMSRLTITAKQLNTELVDNT